MITSVLRFLATCDFCGQPVVVDHPDDDTGVEHFATEGEALTAFSADPDKAADGDLDTGILAGMVLDPDTLPGEPAGRHICFLCLIPLLCQTRGHRLTPWRGCLCAVNILTGEPVPARHPDHRGLPACPQVRECTRPGCQHDEERPTAQVVDLSIRVFFTHGPVLHGDEVVAIGTYPDEAARDLDLVRLRALAGDPKISPWRFEPYHYNRDGADLWADTTRVAAATADLVGPESLLREPDRLLELLHDPTEGQRGWYSIDADGAWVDIRDTLDTYATEDVVTAADGTTVTVGALVALAFRGGLDPGQAESGDPLRLHLLSTHANLAALGLTDAEAVKAHEHEHAGPGAIRSHDPNETFWNVDRINLMLIEDYAGEAVCTGEQADLYARWAGHYQRHQIRFERAEEASA